MVVKGGKVKDLIITICCDTKKVVFNRDFIGLTGENLQGNIIVDFKNKEDFVDGTAYFEVDQDGKKYFIEMTKDEANKVYTLPIKSSLLKIACKLKCQVTIRKEATESGEVPTFKSREFILPCLSSVDAIEEIPSQYPLWFDEVNNRLAGIEQELNGISALLDEINGEVV